jgi:penicillin-binding protein 2
MMATVANEGYYYTPHIIKLKVAAIDPKFKEKHQTTIDKVFQTDDQSLFDVYNLEQLAHYG